MAKSEASIRSNLLNFADKLITQPHLDTFEFLRGQMFTTGELASAGVDMALYCCSAYRAMNKAALDVYRAIRRDGTQKNVLDAMQTRAELYELMGYDAYAELDRSLAREDES